MKKYLALLCAVVMLAMLGACAALRQTRREVGQERAWVDDTQLEVGREP